MEIKLDISPIASEITEQLKQQGYTISPLHAKYLQDAVGSLIRLRGFNFISWEEYIDIGNRISERATDLAKPIEESERK